LQGDDDDFDNVVFVASMETNHVRVAYLGAASPKNTRQPLYFIDRAFQQTRQQAIDLIVYAPEMQIPPRDLESAGLVISAGGIAQESIPVIRDAIANGKTLLFAMAREGDAAALTKIVGTDALTVKEARPPGYAML